MFKFIDSFHELSLFILKDVMGIDDETLDVDPAWGRISKELWDQNNGKFEGTTIHLTDMSGDFWDVSYTINEIQDIEIFRYDRSGFSDYINDYYEYIELIFNEFNPPIKPSEEYLGIFETLVVVNNPEILDHILTFNDSSDEVKRLILKQI